MGESSLLCLSTLQESDYHLYPVNREFKEQGGAFKAAVPHGGACVLFRSHPVHLPPESQSQAALGNHISPARESTLQIFFAGFFFPIIIFYTMSSLLNFLFKNTISKKRNNIYIYMLVRSERKLKIHPLLYWRPFWKKVGTELTTKQEERIKM